MSNAKICLWALALSMFLTAFGSVRLALSQQTEAQDQKSLQKQREHGKLYKRYGSKEKLPDLAAKASGDFSITEGVGQRVFRPGATQGSLLNRLACNADAVIIGTVGSKVSQLTEDENFIFTDYEMHVQEVLKNNPTAPILAGSNITLTRPGGVVQLNGVNVTALAEEYLPLDFNGRYLLFLNFIPTTGSYKAVGSAGSLQLKGRKTIKLTQESLPPELETDADATSLLNSVRSLLSHPCAK
jgi:hypothetical protein